MQRVRRGRASGSTLWAIVILLWAATAAADQKVQDIPLGAAPQSLAVNSVTKKIYVTANPGSVYVVDAVTYAVVKVVSVGTYPGTGANGIAVNTTTNKTYVADNGNGAVSVIDGTDYSVHSITVGNEPLNIAVNESANVIYVTNYQDNTVSAIDGLTEKVTPFSTGSGPRWLAVNTVTNKVYVANQDGTVTVVDGAAKKTISILVGSNLGQIAVNTQTNKIYVGNNTQSQTGIAVIDGVTNTVTNTVSCAASWGVALNSATNEIFASNYLADTVTAIYGGSNLASPLTAPGQPKYIAINSVNNRVYVANYLDSEVTVIDGATYQTATVTVGLDPSAIGVTLTPNLVFVANMGSNSLSVIDPTLPFISTGPSVSITSPTDGSLVSGTVTLQASASAGLALAGVQFAVDGVNLGQPIASAPYTVSWDTTQTTNASHTITAVATDSAGNTATSSVNVTVANVIPNFVLSIQANSTTSATVAPGGTATYLLNLISGATFSGSVLFTCSGAPATTLCTVSPANPSVVANETVPLTVTVTTMGQSASTAHPGRGRTPFAFAMALLVPFALAAGHGSLRRKTIGRWVAAGLLALMMLLHGCGGGGSPPVTSFPLIKSTSTPAGTFTLTITGTSGTETPQNITLTLTVS